MPSPFDQLAPMTQVAPVPINFQWCELVYEIDGQRRNFHVLYLRTGLGDFAPHFDEDSMRKLIADGQTQLSGIEVVREMPHLPRPGSNGDTHQG